MERFNRGAYEPAELGSNRKMLPALRRSTTTPTLSTYRGSFSSISPFHSTV